MRWPAVHAVHRKLCSTRNLAHSVIGGVSARAHRRARAQERERGGDGNHPRGTLNPSGGQCTQTKNSVHKSAQTETIGNRCAFSMCSSYQVCTSMHNNKKKCHFLCTILPIFTRCLLVCTQNTCSESARARVCVHIYFDV